MFSTLRVTRDKLVRAIWAMPVRLPDPHLPFEPPLPSDRRDKSEKDDTWYRNGRALKPFTPDMRPAQCYTNMHCCCNCTPWSCNHDKNACPERCSNCEYDSPYWK